MDRSVVAQATPCYCVVCRDNAICIYACGNVMPPLPLVVGRAPFCWLRSNSTQSTLHMQSKYARQYHTHGTSLPFLFQPPTIVRLHQGCPLSQRTWSTLQGLWWTHPVSLVRPDFHGQVAKYRRDLWHATHRCNKIHTLSSACWYLRLRVAVSQSIPINATLLPMGWSSQSIGQPWQNLYTICKLLLL